MFTISSVLFSSLLLFSSVCFLIFCPKIKASNCLPLNIWVLMSGAPITTREPPTFVIYKMIETRTSHLEEYVVNKDILNNMRALRILQRRQVFLKAMISWNWIKTGLNVNRIEISSTLISHYWNIVALKLFFGDPILKRGWKGTTPIANSSCVPPRKR